VGLPPFEGEPTPLRGPGSRCSFAAARARLSDDTTPGGTTDKLDDVDYPAYTTGTAAELLGVQPAFLRSLDAAGLLSSGRSAGGQRRYSRADLTLATRVRALLDQNMSLAAATRIVSLEHQLSTAHRRITHLEQTLEQTTGQSSADASDR
jgi:MerR family transcriptional regulator/heat shock protein HspR